MLDDPLSLLGYAVWTLALGMWPVALASTGFLFGACSKCCECPGECDKCTHGYNQTQCADLIDGYELTAYGVTFSDTYPQGSGGCSWSSIDFEEFFFDGNIDAGRPQCVADEAEPFNITWRGRAVIQAGPVTDECGCLVMKASVGMRVRLSYEGLVLEIDVENEQIIDSCDGGQVSFALDFNDGTAVEDLWEIDSDCLDELKAWLQTALNPSASLTLKTCDCGACCDDDQCEEDVAEGGCTDWQGVGVSCDPDPC
jgi:hypothetical protein